MTYRKLIVPIILGWSATVAAAQVGVDLAPKFSVGMSGTYEVELQQRRVAHRAEVQTSHKLDHQGVLRWRVLGIGEEGVSTLSMAFEEVQIETTASGVVASAKARAQEDGTSDLQIDEQSTAVQRAASGLVSRVFRIDVDRSGKVMEVYGAAPLLDEVDPAVAPMALGPFHPAAMARTFSLMWYVDTPEASGNHLDRAVGDVWTIEQVSRLGASLGTIIEATEYRVESIADGVVELRTRTESRATAPTAANTDPAVPTLTVTGPSANGTLTWDAESGMLERRERRSTKTTRATIGDVSSVVESETSLRIDRR